MKRHFFKSWQQAFRSYFTYTRGERNGLLVLSGLSCAALLFPTFYGVGLERETLNAAQQAEFAAKVAIWQAEQNDESKKNVFDNIEIKSELAAFNPNLSSFEELCQIGFSPKVARTMLNYRSKGGRFREATDLKKVYGLSESEYLKFLPFVSLEPTVSKTATAEHRPPQYETAKNENWAWNLKLFDPNTATEQELLTLGFPQRIVTIMSNYKKSGAIFKKKEDLKKIYGLTEDIYVKIENYVQIADNQSKINNNFSKEKMTAPSTKLSIGSSTVDLNKATEEELVKIPRIGRTFAARITSYRARLGGFCRAEQLKEVYGLPDSVYQLMLPFCKIDVTAIKKIKINALTSADDCRHPYITRKQLEVLLRYKINHGNYMNFQGLARTGVFTQENLQLLQPYLNFE